MIELWYNRPFSQIIEEVEDEVEMDEDERIGVWEAACHVVQTDWLVKDAGSRYAEVVRKCVLGLDCGMEEVGELEEGWGGEEFRRKVGEEVVGGLEWMVGVWREGGGGE